MAAPRTTSPSQSMRKIAILGATSGITLAVERLLAERGCDLLDDCDRAGWW